jgi:hypothetical protein
LAHFFKRRQNTWAGNPGTSTRKDNTQPAHGCSASSAAGRPRRDVVMNSVCKSGPPKQGIVGQRTGSGTSRSVTPCGDRQSNRCPSNIATQ